MQRILAIVERELRRFRRRPVSIAMAVLFSLVQLVVMGYAFGGQVRDLKVGIVDHDRGPAAIKLRELAGAVASGPRTFDLVDYVETGQALTDLRNGRIHGVLAIPSDFSRRALLRADPRIALITDNTDNFVAAALSGSFSGLLAAYNEPALIPARVPSPTTLEVVELYPYVPYVQYLLAGTIALSMVTMVGIGGGIIYIDEKASGVHEGYLVTPITRFELVAGFNLSGAIKAALAGIVVMALGAPIAGVPHAFEPARLAYILVVIVLTAFALMSLMFVLVVRVNDPLVPRVMFGVLNTLLFFPSGAVYPQQAFPDWMQLISRVNPFAFSVHALKNLLLRNTGLDGVLSDLVYLTVFSVVAMAVATMLFKRTL